MSKKREPKKVKTATTTLNVEDNPLASPYFDPLGMWTGMPFIAPSDIPEPEQDPDDL